jgi:2-dehydro-3-deoxygalactonokinase
MVNNSRFISCDWGTTAFRLRLVETAGYSVLAEVSSKQGIAAVYSNWSKSGQPEHKRVAFYLGVLQENILRLKQQIIGRVDAVPVIISGMASSTLGMMELPYKALPFALDGSDLRTQLIEPNDTFLHPVLLISGVRTEDDVMRGEETQLIGCNLMDTDEEQLVIHPGTHSKHINVKNGLAVSFGTFMTGELFSLLSTESILATSAEKNEDFSEPGNLAHFGKGLKDGAKLNLLHALFYVRTGGLFKIRSKFESYHYLSGLLIGSELSAFPKNYTGTIILAGGKVLVQQYEAAIKLLGIADKARELIIKQEDEITIAGQYAVYRRQCLLDKR